MGRLRDHHPRFTSWCPDSDACKRLYHGTTDLFVGDTCECCGQEVVADEAVAGTTLLPVIDQQS